MTEQLHGRADHFISLFVQQRGGDGTVHTTTHRHQHSLSAHALRRACDLELPLIEAAIAQYTAYVEERGAADAETVSITRLYQD